VKKLEMEVFARDEVKKPGQSGRTDLLGGGSQSPITSPPVGGEKKKNVH